ncbi:treS [Acrasis kona]|uniref:TreS n=1 Tax=Acrasis kona TaxID=1008807 RepID=A0AAW2Z688_9EUKA
MSTNMNPTTQRRLNVLMRQHLLSKPLLLANKATTSLEQSINQGSKTSNKEGIITDSNNNKDELGVQQAISELESGKINVDQALDRAMDFVEGGSYNTARKVVFSTTPYCENDLQTTRGYRIIGLSYYKHQDFKNALPWFKKASQASTSIQDWFNLASAAAQMEGQEYLAAQAFEQLEKLHTNASFQSKPSFWNHLYWYVISLMNGEKYAMAFTQLNRLKLAYKRARFTDAEYLAEIGLPSFEDFLTTSLLLFKRINKMHQAEEFLRVMIEHVDDTGKKVIHKLIESMKSDNNVNTDDVISSFVSS